MRNWSSFGIHYGLFLGATSAVHLAEDHVGCFICVRSFKQFMCGFFFCFWMRLVEGFILNAESFLGLFLLSFFVVFTVDMVFVHRIRLELNG